MTPTSTGQRPARQQKPLHQPAATASSSFPVRRMDYGFESVPRYWCADDPALTHFFTGFSLLFPEGEAYFVRAVRALRGKVEAGSQLDKDIGSFIGQEAMHSKEHHAFHVSARKYGLDPDSLEAVTGNVLKLLEKYLSKKSNLLITVGLEHYTAVMGTRMMESVNELITEDTIRNLWLWHSVEETEHKAVAFDMYQNIYEPSIMSYAHRVAAFGFALTLVTGLSYANTTVLMKRDGQLKNIKSWKNLASLGLKQYPVILPKLLQYLRPGFHPNQIDEAALVAATKKRIGLATH